MVSALFVLSTMGADRDDPVLWMWSGGVTADRAVVKVKLKDSSADAELVLSPVADFSKPRTVVPEDRSGPGVSGVLTFDLDGLGGAGSWWYRVRSGGRLSPVGHFRTFPRGPRSFLVAFGSCASTGSRHRVWEQILSHQPDLFVHMGDFHYENIRHNRPDLFRKAMDRSLSALRQSELYHSTAVAYVWDDHDFGPDNADGTSPSKPAALQVYQEYVPHYPLGTRDGKVESIQQAFDLGRVRFILTDVRSERAPEREPDRPGKTMLGNRQREWLLRELEQSRDRALVVWVNAVPWITKATPGTVEGWEAYGWERRVIADRIRELGLTDRLLMLSGDAHMVAMDDGTHSNYAGDAEAGEKGFPVVHAAPIDRYPRRKGGPYTHGTAPRSTRLLGFIPIQQYGLMEVEDDGTTLKVRLTGRNRRGQVLSGMEMKLSCGEVRCSVIR